MSTPSKNENSETDSEEHINEEEKENKENKKEQKQKPQFKVTFFRGEDGIIYTWDEKTHLYTPQIDEETFEEQQSAYQYQPPAIPAKKSLKRKRKSKAQSQNSANINDPTKLRTKVANCGIYVKGLPLDTTALELADYVRKCGVIKKDPETAIEQVKIYVDQTGNPKGDARVTYFRPESVQLAVQYLHDTEFRPGHKIEVSEAVWEKKPGIQKPKKKKRDKKKKYYNQAQELSWEEKENKHVIIKHMFHPSESYSDPEFFRVLETEILDEAVKLGAVHTLKVFEHNPEGVVAIKFEKGPAAEKCVKVMNGRFFGGRKLECFFYDGFTDFHVEESDESKAEREKLWTAHLEGQKTDEQDDLVK